MIDNQEIERLWQYRTQAENVFYQRINFFLVAESMLLVAYATVLSKENFLFTAITIITIGILLTVIWLIVNHRQKITVDHVRNYIIDKLPEYRSLRQNRPKSFISSWILMTYLVPLLLIFSWITLLVVFLVDTRTKSSPTPFIIQIDQVAPLKFEQVLTK